MNVEKSMFQSKFTFENDQKAQSIVDKKLIGNNPEHH